VLKSVKIYAFQMKVAIERALEKFSKFFSDLTLMFWVSKTFYSDQGNVLVKKDQLDVTIKRY